MSHNILSLQQDCFITRILLGGCIININGNTLDCQVSVDTSNITSPTFTVSDVERGAVLCTFRPYHLSEGPLFYQIAGASLLGASATLVVPTHGMLQCPEQEFAHELV